MPNLCSYLNTIPNKKQIKQNIIEYYNPLLPFWDHPSVDWLVIPYLQQISQNILSKLKGKIIGSFSMVCCLFGYLQWLCLFRQLWRRLDAWFDVCQSCHSWSCQCLLEISNQRTLYTFASRIDLKKELFTHIFQCPIDNTNYSKNLTELNERIRSFDCLYFRVVVNTAGAIRILQFLLFLWACYSKLKGLSFDYFFFFFQANMFFICF